MEGLEHLGHMGLGPWHVFNHTCHSVDLLQASINHLKQPFLQSFKKVSLQLTLQTLEERERFDGMNSEPQASLQLFKVTRRNDGLDTIHVPETFFRQLLMQCKMNSYVICLLGRYLYGSYYLRPELNNHQHTYFIGTVTYYLF